MDFVIRLVAFLLPILFGAFSARRLNFIHGFLVTIAWYLVIAGGCILIYIYLADNQTVIEFINKYLIYIITIPNLVAAELLDLFNEVGENFYTIIGIAYIVVPIVIVCISGFLARMFRRKRLGVIV